MGGGGERGKKEHRGSTPPPTTRGPSLRGPRTPPRRALVPRPERPYGHPGPRPIPKSTSARGPSSASFTLPREHDLAANGDDTDGPRSQRLAVRTRRRLESRPRRVLEPRHVRATPDTPPLRSHADHRTPPRNAHLDITPHARLTATVALNSTTLNDAGPHRTTRRTAQQRRDRWSPHTSLARVAAPRRRRRLASCRACTGAPRPTHRPSGTRSCPGRNPAPRPLRTGIGALSRVGRGLKFSDWPDRARRVLLG